MKMILNKPHADAPQILIANTNSIQKQGLLIHTIPKEEKKMCWQICGNTQNVFFSTWRQWDSGLEQILLGLMDNSGTQR